MVGAGAGEVGDVEMLRRRFPFCFGRQALFCLGGVGGRFVITNMAHRRIVINWAKSGKRKLDPAVLAVPLPIEGSFPAFTLDHRPPVRVLEFPKAVTTVFDEFQEFAVGHAT